MLPEIIFNFPVYVPTVFLSQLEFNSFIGHKRLRAIKDKCKGTFVDPEIMRIEDLVRIQADHRMQETGKIDALAISLPLSSRGTRGCHYTIFYFQEDVIRNSRKTPTPQTALPTRPRGRKTWRKWRPSCTSLILATTPTYLKSPVISKIPNLFPPTQFQPP